ncbi:MAG: radical SAM protein [Pseudomonadota bacterium]
MPIDVIIIADAGASSFSATNPLKLTLDGCTADIQTVMNYVENDGRITPPVAGDGILSWAAAPKLNGISLTNVLSRHHIRAEIIDSYLTERDRFNEMLLKSPAAVVISTTFITDKETLRIMAADIRSAAPDITIIAGGAFVYTSYLLMRRSSGKDYDTDSGKKQFLFLETADEPDIDLYVVSLRGERILLQALENLMQNRPYKSLPNTAHRSGAGYDFSPRVDDISRVEDVPIDWDQMPDTVFRSGVVSLQASTGCTSHCAFCNFSKDPRMNRIKPLDEMVAEMKAVARRGVKYVWFTDDNFRLGRKDLAAVCRRIAEEGLGLKWMTFIRAGAIEDVDVQLLVEAGCTEVQMGLESGDPQVLKNMNKMADPALYDRVLRKLLSAGINCSCYFLFGFPGETAETARRTRAFLKALDALPYDGSLSWSLFPFFLIPMSPVYEPEMRKIYGLTGYMEHWRHRTMDSKTASRELIATFLALENSGPIYRGDNLDILERLGTAVRKRFHAARHALSKQAYRGSLDPVDVIRAFRAVLPSDVFKK